MKHWKFGAGRIRDTSSRLRHGPVTGAAVMPSVVLQVSNPEPRGWHQTLNVATALTKNAGWANVQIEIVANGMGVKGD